MVEFAVVVGVFVLLALGTELIYRFQEVQRQAVIGARQAAFSAAWLGDRVPATDVQARLRTGHFEHAGWMDPTGNEAMPSREESVSLALQQGPAPGRAAAAVAEAMRPLRAVGSYLSEGFDLTPEGFRRATVRVVFDPVTSLPSPLDAIAPDFEEHGAVLGDAWNSGSPAQVAGRTAGLVPTALLAEKAAWLTPATLPLRLLEPALARLCLGLIEPELVPADRLSGGGAGVPQPGQVGCR